MAGDTYYNLNEIADIYLRTADELKAVKAVAVYDLMKARARVSDFKEQHPRHQMEMETELRNLWTDVRLAHSLCMELDTIGAKERFAEEE